MNGDNDLPDVSMQAEPIQVSDAAEEKPHIRLCPLLWSELFRTIALLLGVLRDFIVGLFKTELGKRRV